MKHLSEYRAPEPAECLSGQMLQGVLKPDRCTPEHPLGAAMVSPEGACAAYYHYRRGTDGRLAPHAASFAPLSIK